MRGFSKINLYLFKYALIVIICISCQDIKKSNITDSKETKSTATSILLNDIWVLIKKEDIAVTDTTQKRPQLEFQVSKKIFFGNDGCNQISGKLERLTNFKLEFSIIGGTRMRCPNMEEVNTYLGLLKRVQYYKIGDLELSLQDADKKILLIYKKVD